MHKLKGIPDNTRKILKNYNKIINKKLKLNMIKR